MSISAKVARASSSARVEDWIHGTRIPLTPKPLSRVGARGADCMRPLTAWKTFSSSSCFFFLCSLFVPQVLNKLAHSFFDLIARVGVILARGRNIAPSSLPSRPI